MTCNTAAVAVCGSQSLARLGQQPRVLHRNDRLRREVLQQRDLLIGERPNLGPVDYERANERRVLPQSYPNRGASTKLVGQPSPYRIA